jgi:NADPH-dependent curcumin reductase CurA
MSESRRMVLMRRPVGQVRDDDFELQSAPVPEPGEGEVVVRVCWLSFDPAQRGWLDDVKSYIPPVALGEAMRATGVGQIVASRRAEFPVGALVSGTFGWQEHAVSDGGGMILPLRHVPDGVPPTAALGILGTTGLTAYFGLLEVGRMRERDVVLVSGAAGATGSTVGQIAKLKGAAKVIGIAGGPDKCAWLTEVAGFDAAIDYKHEDVARRIGQLAPDGVDLYYDNVGGAILDAALANLAQAPTVVMGGAIATRFPTNGQAVGVYNLTTLLVKRGRLQGFILLDFADRFDEGVAQLGAWLREGRILAAEDVQRGGLEQAPATLRRLFEGGNLGKQLLQIAEPVAS